MIPDKPSYSIDGNDGQIHSSLHNQERCQKLWQQTYFLGPSSREIDPISMEAQTVRFYFLKEALAPKSGSSGRLSGDQLFATGFFLTIHPLFTN